MGLKHAITAGIPARTDLTRARLALLQQTMLAGSVLIIAVFVVATGYPGDIHLFLTAVLALLAVTGATLLVPWNNLPVFAVAVVPAVDIAIILMLRVSYPSGGFGLLWMFPVMWLSAILGILGFIVTNIIVATLYWWSILTHGGYVGSALALLPLVILAVSSATYFSVRRSEAQRVLLDKQAALLGRTLERALHQEQLVSQVLDAVDFGATRIAPDGAVTVSNEAHARIQRSLLDSDGITPLPAYLPDGRTELPLNDTPLARAMRGEVFDNQIVWYGPPDGVRRAISVTARRLRDAHRADAGVVIITRDVTAERTALRARDNIVASVSHELRSPLTAIVGYLDLALESEGIPPKVRDDLEIATANADRMIEILADILSATSASGSSVDVTISAQDVDLQRLVLDAAHAWEPSAMERRITIFTDDIGSAQAYIDPARVRQVIDNLISNALKYGRDGGSVQLAVYSDGAASWVLVRDDGIGIAPGDQQRLFSRFFRANTEVGGTGLGLTISRDIVRAHGGEIIVGSEAGRGSAFLVRLPSRPDQTLPPVDPEDALQMSGAITTAGRTEGGTPR